MKKCCDNATSYHEFVEALEELIVNTKPKTWRRKIHINDRRCSQDTKVSIIDDKIYLEESNRNRIVITQSNCVMCWLIDRISLVELIITTKDNIKASIIFLEKSDNFGGGG